LIDFAESRLLPKLATNRQKSRLLPYTVDFVDFQQSRPCWIQLCRQCVPGFRRAFGKFADVDAAVRQRTACGMLRNGFCAVSGSLIHLVWQQHGPGSDFVMDPREREYKWRLRGCGSGYGTGRGDRSFTRRWQWLDAPRSQRAPFHTHSAHYDIGNRGRCSEAFQTSFYFSAVSVQLLLPINRVLLPLRLYSNSTTAIFIFIMNVVLKVLRINNKTNKHIHHWLSDRLDV